MPIFQVKIDSNILDILLSEKLIASKAEGKRLIGQNAIKIDGEICSDIGYVAGRGCGEPIVKIRKRRFLKISG